MKLLSFLCVIACLELSGTASAHTGMASHMSTARGGALGTSAAAPGTNSLGIALPSSEGDGHAMKRPLLGTDAAIDKEDARLEKMLEGAICRGC